MFGVDHEEICAFTFSYMVPNRYDLKSGIRRKEKKILHKKEFSDNLKELKGKKERKNFIIY